MKRSIWTRALALLLVFFMLAPDAAAAGFYGNRARNPFGSSWGSIWEDLLEDIWEKLLGGDKEETEEETEEETTPENSVSEGTVLEDATTADNPQMLRAATFALNSRAGTNVVYFPVTMYNYDQDTINAATDELDDDLTVREGLYFSNGGTEVPYTRNTTTANTVAYTVENGNVVIPDGSYLLYCTDTSYYVTDTVNTSSPWTTTVLNGTGANAYASASLWTFTRQSDGTYTIQNTDGEYLTITGANSANLTTEQNTVTIGVQDSGAYTFTVYDDAGGDNAYLNSLGDTWYGVGYFGGYSEGSAFCIRSVTEGDNSIVSGYEAWNRWDKASGNRGDGDLIYTGLVQPELVDDQIVFNVNEGGIFNNDTSVKDIYEYVGLPFVLDTTTGVYSFDSDVNGVYFEGTPQSGTAEAPHNLYFAEGAPQPMPSDLTVGDGSTNAFFPFNNQSSYTSGQVDYHFGMRADLPFSMTPNGRIKSTDDESAPISFTFSGDDDVWVFIDGHLVIDLGGIHNRLDVTIDFAANTITYSEENAQDTDNVTASYNDPDFAMTQKLFTDSEGEGVIPMTRDAFALQPTHEMQVFYLERGEGTSNCHIEFNLPMTDTVLITKDASKSWSQAAEDADLANGVDEDLAGVDQLTDAEQAIVNNIDFGFTLYKKEADATEFTPVANTNFYLIGRGVEGVVINQTDANGHFYLKNGQSAKFITELPMEGVTYYVVEDQVPDGFVSPDFNFAGKATYDYTYTDGTTTGTASATDASEIPEQIIPMPTKDENGKYVGWAENKSYEVTVKGSIEANDSIEFICSNYLDAELPNPTALAYEDIIVIDYGLPVIIDPLANDVFRGDDIEIIAFGGPNMTLGEVLDKDGDGIFEDDELDITYDTDNFQSGSVDFNDKTYAVNGSTVTRDTFTYTLNKQLTDVEVITYIIKVTGKDVQDATQEDLTQNDYAIGKIYIVPATVMYYEDNFANLITYTNSKTASWGGTEYTDGASDYQEPGVVGTTNDSIYGSDVAYRNDSYDSNGTSRYADTTDGAVRFQYTFTGTGTTIFARTSATTGYVQFKLYEGDTATGDYMRITYRDTYYKDENTSELDSDGVLYNIPIYTVEDLDYGTYTVVATVAKAGTPTDGNVAGSGNEFFLDGIRIMQPLNEIVTEYDEFGDPVSYDELTTKALGAYATDGESNIDTITLRYKLIIDNEQSFDPDLGETETEWPFAVMTDIEGEIVYASDYVTIGPKEEVYLLPGQSVTFAIKYWHPDGYRMHMGMKAPFGTAEVKVGQTTFALNNAMDCYYDITGLQYSVVTETDEFGDTYYVATYTFTATDKIVSLTNIKIVGNYEFVLVDDGGNSGEEEGGDIEIEGDGEDITVDGNEGE